MNKPKYKEVNGFLMELDEKHNVYVFAGNPIVDEPDEDYRLSIFYGKERERYLMEYHPDVYINLQLNARLKSHLIDIDKKANEMEEKLIKEMAKSEGLTEDMKNTDFLKWVGLMNNIILTVRELIQRELIYQL